MVNSIIANSKDDVVTTTCALKKGDEASYFEGEKILSVIANEDIPEYHKLAVKPVKKGDVILKYGEIIGRAKADIKVGDYVHTHNLSSDGR